jgi:3-mercaptopyruvate sulfurtransferase SseA
MMTPDMLVVVYCDGEKCELSHEVQARLRGLGYKNVRVLINGWTLWQAAGLPGHTGDQP